MLVAMPVSGVPFFLSFTQERSICVVLLLIYEDITSLSLPSVISVSPYILFRVLFDVR